jgi:hypothetical protein
MASKEFKAGQSVRIDSMDHVLEVDKDYVIGEICEVIRTNEEGRVEVYTSDKSDYWYFDPDQLTLIMDRDK